jgi:TrmH family RNA methyltransferase
MNEKLIRATAGLCLRRETLLQAGDARALAVALRERGYRVFVLDPRGAQSLRDVNVQPEEKLALVFGNEAGGVDRATWGGFEALRIPMEEGVESLNVAASGAIALYELSRRPGP